MSRRVYPRAELIQATNAHATRLHTAQLADALNRTASEAVQAIIPAHDPSGSLVAQRWRIRFGNPHNESFRTPGQLPGPWRSLRHISEQSADADVPGADTQPFTSADTPHSALQRGAGNGTDHGGVPTAGSVAARGAAAIPPPPNSGRAPPLAPVDESWLKPHPRSHRAALEGALEDAPGSTNITHTRLTNRSNSGMAGSTGLDNQDAPRRKQYWTATPLPPRQTASRDSTAPPGFDCRSPSSKNGQDTQRAKGPSETGGFAVRMALGAKRPPLARIQAISVPPPIQSISSHQVYPNNDACRNEVQRIFATASGTINPTDSISHGGMTHTCPDHSSPWRKSTSPPSDSPSLHLPDSDVRASHESGLAANALPVLEAGKANATAVPISRTHSNSSAEPNRRTNAPCRGAKRILRKEDIADDNRATTKALLHYLAQQL